MNPRTVLLIDLDPTTSLSTSLRAILVPALSKEHDFQHRAIGRDSLDIRDAEVRSALSEVTPSLVFLALPSAGCDQPPESINSLFQLLSIPTIVATERAEPEEMFKLLELGATDFIITPFTPLGVLPRMWRLLEQCRARDDLKHSLKQKLGLKHLIGKSAGFVAEVNRIPIVAKSDVTVLILGETGTGKELFARAIHYLGPRAAKPFVPVNCGAIPADLVENELFGHERGAYTSASSSKTGLVAEADGGTLFLDEIDCLPLMAQGKAAQVYSGKGVSAVGFRANSPRRLANRRRQQHGPAHRGQERKHASGPLLSPEHHSLFASASAR